MYTRTTDHFYWLDYRFGATLYQSTTSNAWNHTKTLLAASLRGGARFIVTSRDYVSAAARSDLKLIAFPLLDEASVVIQVQSFTREEREQLLYNPDRKSTRLNSSH